MRRLKQLVFLFVARMLACTPHQTQVSGEATVFASSQIRFPFLEVIDSVSYLSASLHPDAVRYPDEDTVIWPTLTRGYNHYLSSFVKTPHGVLGTAYITQRIDSTSEQVFSLLSDDIGITWRPRIGILWLPRPQKQRDANWGGFLMHRSILAMTDGQLCGSAYGGFIDDTAYRAIWVCSNDVGFNWDVVSTIAYSAEISDEGFGEPVVAQTDRALVAVLRTGHGLLHSAISLDRGASWSTPQPIPDTYLGFDPELVWTGHELLLLFGNGISSIKMLTSDSWGLVWRHCPDIVFDSQSSGYVGARLVNGRLLVVTDGHGETAIVSKMVDIP